MSNNQKDEEEELLQIKNTINTILNQDIVFKKSPVIEINNIYFNADMFVITLIFIIIWIITWWVFGFFNIGHYTIIFFFLYIFNGIFNIFESPLSEESNSIFSKTKYYDILSKGETFLSIIVILYIFVFNLNMNDDCKKQIYKVLTITLIFSCFLLFKVKFEDDDTRTIKNLIIVEKKINNQIIILFLLCIYLIFICHKKI